MTRARNIIIKMNIGSCENEILLKHLRSDVVLFISPNEKDHVVDTFVLRTLNAVYKNSYKDVSMHIREM